MLLFFYHSIYIYKLFSKYVLVYKMANTEIEVFECVFVFIDNAFIAKQFQNVRWFLVNI